MVTQMTESEMIVRLDRGEAPIDISIDKWKRLKEYFIQDGHRQDITFKTLSFHSNTCALCESTRRGENDDVYCDECPLVWAGFIPCGKPDSAWHDFAEIFYNYIYEDPEITPEEVVQYIDRMIDVLKETKSSWNVKLMKQMTYDEVSERLNAGEDPIDLSIEKWERIKSYIIDIWKDSSLSVEEREGLLCDINYHGDSCALCQSSYALKNISNPSIPVCEFCPLVQVGFIECDHRGSTWRNFNSAYENFCNDCDESVDILITAADDMINELKEVKLKIQNKK